MGVMIDGAWHGDRTTVPTADGRFVRPESVFRDRIAPGNRFPPQPGRYHLYVSLACPWAHRTVIFRRLKGLEDMIGMSVSDAAMGDDGWTFPGSDDPLGIRALHEVYARADPRYTGRVTVPVLWDTSEATIVNNESSEIIRIFNSAFDGAGATPGDFYPEALRSEIDAVNARVYATVNNGVYRAGFARSQEAYEDAVRALFDTLDWLEDRLTHAEFLCGDRITEADWRLFTTLVRFDSVYVGHFKCNIRRLVDYPALWAYARRLYRVPGVAGTVDVEHTKRHYYQSHPWLNPTGIVPAGPEISFD